MLSLQPGKLFYDIPGCLSMPGKAGQGWWPDSPANLTRPAGVIKVGISTSGFTPHVDLIAPDNLSG